VSREHSTGIRCVGRQLRLELRDPSSFRRRDFIVAPSNAAAVRTLDAWPNWHAGCLALIGPEGSGKTHLAVAWARRSGAAVLQAGDTDPLDLSGLHGRPILLEDADRGAPDELLFHLINMAGEVGGGLLLTARALPSGWPAALPDLRSRLNALTIAHLPPPDDQVLEGVLRKFLIEHSIKPTDDLIGYLTRRIERSVPRAREVVERLDALADAEQRPATRALARQILEIRTENPDEDE
jgi:chromosomal replication initiation ATPase DnaA